MMHRPIAPIQIHGFTPGGTPRAQPIFEWVAPTSLLIDEGYQRDSSERSLKLVRKIVSNWDWARFKPPVAVMTDAGLELVDGQHTAIAAATHPDVALIPVMIVEAAHRSDRASAFIGHNRDRVAVTATQLHIAAMAAGDAESLAVARVCERTGLTILRSPRKDYAEGETLSVTAIAALIRGRGELGAERVLSVCAAARLAPVTQHEIKAVDLLLFNAEYSTQITPEALTATIQAMELHIDRDAAVFRAAHPSTPLWKAMAIVWFKNRRGAKPNLASVPSLRPSLPTDKAAFAVSDTGPIAKPARDDRPRVLLQPNRKGESIADAIKRDERPALRGWKPGNHLRRCDQCGDSFVGNVRSHECAECAYRAEQIVSMAGQV